MFPSRYTSCPDCGASVERKTAESHACDPERWLDYQVFHLREEIEGFEAALASYLDSPQGRFELWYAMRQRRDEDRLAA